MSRATRESKRKPGQRSSADAQALEQSFSAALRMHQGGQAEEAEKSYRKILQNHEDHVGALYYLALLMNETGRSGDALGLMDKAVKIQPADAVLQNNFGNLLREAGRIEEAVLAYQMAAKINPSYANAYFNLGMALHDSGDAAGAQKAFETVAALDPGDAHGWNALGTTLAEQGEPEKALECLERAAQLRPRDPQVAYNHAGCLRQLNRVDDAADEYRRAVDIQPGYVEANYNLALVERLRGNDVAAEHAFQNVLRTNPRHAKAMVGLASIRRDAGDRQAAIPLLLDAIELDSENARAAGLMLACFQDENKLDAGIKMLSARLATNPESLGIRMALGEMLMELDEWDAAASHYAAVIERIPDHAGAHNGLSQAYDRLRRTDEAIAICHKAIEYRPDFADAHCNLGLALRQKGQTRAAIKAYNDAVKLDQNYSAAWNNLGVAYTEVGEIEKALECYGRAVRLEPELAAAYLNISRAKKFTASDKPEIERIEAMAGRGGLPDEVRANFHGALGKMYEDCGEYDKAFPHYLESNRFMRKRHRFDRDNFLKWAGQFRTAFNEQFFTSVKGFGDPSRRMVFIVGMPRSGTTLVEQILSSHPDVYGADELTKVAELAETLPERLGVRGRYPNCVASLDAETAAALANEYLSYVDSLAGPESLVTDKMPTNFYHLGLISAMLPHARVIHCQRDAMDVCFSNFVQIFGEAHYYSYDLSDTAAYYREYEKMMAHWRAVLPLPMLDVSYETLVENQEAESRRLVEFLGLPWDDRCLQFHRTERSVRTASNWQVRQPIYKTSAQRWKRFESHLQALKTDLGYIEKG